MSYYILNSQIKIGTFHFSGVHQLVVRRSLHGYADSATITIPSLCRIKRKGKDEPGMLVTGSQFRDGDKVTIQLGYNGVLREEFRGFVNNVVNGRPLVVECQGYNYQLLRNVISGEYKQTTLVEQLKKVVENTDVKCTTNIDFPIENISYQQRSGSELLKFLIDASGQALQAFFIEPDRLWVGLLNKRIALGTEVLNGRIVKYRIGKNCLGNTKLRVRNAMDEPTSVVFGNKVRRGQVIKSTSIVKRAAKRYVQLLNLIPDEKTLQLFADEREFALNYSGLDGSIKGFLEPCCTVGDIVDVEDSTGMISGKYMAEDVIVTFGVDGARRSIGIGIEVGRDYKELMNDFKIGK